MLVDLFPVQQNWGFDLICNVFITGVMILCIFLETRVQSMLFKSFSFLLFSLLLFCLYLLDLV